MTRIPVYLIASVLFLVASGVRAGTAAVSMPDRYSADAAANILAGGGNAVDAAIAGAFVLAVTHPGAGNIGGGGFMLSHMNGEAAFLDFREQAPGAAHRDMYLDPQGEVIENASLIGIRSVAVPGTVKGMQLAHQRYGSRPWAELLMPAIQLAREGQIVHPKLADGAEERWQEVKGETNFADYFGGLVAGEIFKQPELASTLERIAHDPEEFYSGLTARKIVAQMEKSGGLITLKDLADYKAVWRAPIRATWRNLEVLAAPPPSSGGFALVQLLAMRELTDKHFHNVGHNSPQYIHLLAEIEKRVFADRAEYLGDPDRVNVPIDALLNEKYLATRAKGVNPTAISAPEDVLPGLESSETTHFSILDGDGNAVALTYTLNWDFGSGMVVEGAGFILNDQMDDFSAKPGAKNIFGVIGNTRNAIAPGKRMLSSMSPTIVLQDQMPTMVLGASGGSTIFTSILQVILNVHDHGMSLGDAVNATRFHHQLPDGKLIRHDQWGVPGPTRTALESMGYTVQPNSWGALGRVQALHVDNGKPVAAADRRGRGEVRVIKVGAATAQ